MNITKLENYFSIERLKRYENQYLDNETGASYLYEANIALSETLYTPLCILEVALRNKITHELQKKYGRVDWYCDWYKHPLMHYAWNEINAAIKNLHKDRKPIQPDKVIAGLMFGFWTSLFNEKYERELWPNLRFVFPNMPKAIRIRNNISKPLNDIRRLLRNRIYHNEPIIFNLQRLTTLYQNLTFLLKWMGEDLLAYNNSRANFPSVLEKIATNLEKKHLAG